MTDSSSAKEGLDELVKGIIGSIQSVSATEQAVHKQTLGALEASTQVITELVKNNAYSPELAQETLKMQKAMIDRTIEAIKTLPMTRNDGALKD
jgi:hypothetical protein